MQARWVVMVVVAMGTVLGLPATADAGLTFDRTDYPLPSISPTRLSDVGPGYYDDGPIALIDLNGDNKLDVAIADYGTGQVHVLLNQGAGAFAAATGSPFSGCPSNIAADDIVAGQLNPQVDQHPDVAVYCDFDGGLHRLPGDGSGSFGASESILTGTVAPLKLAHVSGSPGGDYVYGGNGGYLCYVPVTSVADPTAVHCDGGLPASGLSPVHFYDALCSAGDELLTFSGPQTFAGSALSPKPGPGNCTTPFDTANRSSGVAAGVNVTSMTAGDVDGDGHPDVVMGDAAGNIHVTTWQGASTDFAGGIPPGAQPITFASSGPAYALRVADFDGDGCPDIAGAEVLPSEQDAVAIHTGHCSKTQFDLPKTFDVAGDNNTYTDLTKMTVGDLNGDQKPDIVTTAGYAGATTVLLDTSSSSSLPPTRVLTVTTSGTGGGTVSGSGIDCGGAGHVDCSESVTDGSAITLSAYAAAGSAFGGFSGAGCAGTAPCTVAMDADKTVDARFNLLPPVLTQVSMNPTVWAVNKKGGSETAVSAKAPKKGTTFSYALSARARVLFTIERALPGRRAGARCARPSHSNRTKKPCMRYTLFGRFAQKGASGTNTKRFSGRIGKHSLTAGKHRASLVATDAIGGTSKVMRMSFSIVKK